MNQNGNKIFKVYPYRVEPRNYIEYDKRFVKAVTHEDLDNQFQFTTLREFNVNQDNELVDYKKDLTLYTDELELGKVIWPHFSYVFTKNFNELVDEIEKRGLYLFDVYEYWPGVHISDNSTFGGTATEYKCPIETFNYIKSKLGKRFLGLSNGELDGNYIIGYAPFLCPVFDEREKQYFNFHEHFEQIWDDLHNTTSVMCSLNSNHYFAKEGNVMILCSETAQSFINVNLWYSYMRGAGKQYGLIWSGAISLFNRWGYKDYNKQGQHHEGTMWNHYGPEWGTSLSLIRRILYALYLYNSDLFGMEMGLTYESSPTEDSGNDGRPQKTLTPIGELQYGALKFFNDFGYPGTMYTPVAVLMDFYNGWLTPRNFWYNGIYKTWGNLPYKMEDYQVHALFNLLYPGYEGSGFFKDERGFLAATPHADMTDILFSDVRQEVLNAYNTVIIAGKIKLDAELYFKLLNFTGNGGHLIIDIAQIIDVCNELDSYIPGFSGFFGIESIKGKIKFDEDEVIVCESEEITEKAFEIYEIKPIASADTIAYTKKDNLPLISEVTYKTGKVSLITIPYGLNAANLSNADYISDGDTTEKNISMPYDYLNSVKKYIGKCIDKEKIIEVDNEQLQYSINICKDDNILLSVVNNGDNTEIFVVKTNTGTITGIEEIHIPQISRDTTGYYAADKKAEDNGCVEEGKLNIEPKDIKLYKINLKEQYFDKKAEIKINDLSKNNYIALWKIASIKEEILFNPTLKHHFAGIKVDARYLADRDGNVLKKEAEYVKRQNVDIIIDFSSMINHFPGITLLDVKTSKYSEYSRYRESITTIKSIFEKVQLFGCDKAVFISQRNADFGALSILQAVEMLAKSMEEICKLAKAYNITVYLQNGIGGMILDSAEFVKIGAVPTLVKKRDRIENVLDFIRNLNIENLKFALNTCHGIITTEEDVIEIVKSNKNRIGALLISSPYCDDFGQNYNLHSKIFNSKFKETVKNICIAVKESENVDFVCLDGVYSNWSEAYLDSRELRDLS